MMFLRPEEQEQWNKVQKFLETYLKRDVTHELIPNTILEALEKQQKEIEYLKSTFLEDDN